MVFVKRMTGLIVVLSKLEGRPLSTKYFCHQIDSNQPNADLFEATLVEFSARTPNLSSSSSSSSSWELQ